MQANRLIRQVGVGALALVAGLLAGCADITPAPSVASEPVTVRVNVFRGASNIPIYMAMERGNFAKRGVTPVLQFTPSSTAQRDGLATERFEIAHAAVDNAVAMVEVSKHDVIIVAGGDSGMNELIVRAEIKQLADMRGRTFVVDAPNTAYALIGRKIFKNAGLTDGKDYKLNPIGGTQVRIMALDNPNGAATLLNPPWNFIAKDRGAKSLGSTKDLFGAYQAVGVFVNRHWATAHANALERYLAAYIEGCRAALEPANREQAIAVLQRELQLERRIAELTYQDLTTPGHGLAKDCAFDMPGFRNVLALRAEMEGQWDGKAPAPEKYLDLGYYERALPKAGR
jgi:ABC-type nitrate/sulfonate/bicarbonate transport system substrate-binding protein